jgi:hypothetical protein
LPLFVSDAVPEPELSEIVPVTGVWHSLRGSLDIRAIDALVVSPRSDVWGVTLVLERLYTGSAVGRTDNRIGMPLAV